MRGVFQRLTSPTSMLALAVSLVVLVGAALASKASASSWHRVTMSGGASIDEVATLRMGNMLHVAWSSGTNGPSSGMHDTRISAAGKILGSTTIVSGWIGISNPALVTTPGSGIDAIWGGTHTLKSSDPNKNMNSSISLDGGKTWTAPNGDVVNPSNDASGSPVAAANEVGTAQTPIMTWWTSSGVFVHAGISKSGSNYNFHTFGCCGYYSNIAVDGAGQIKLVWFSNASGHLGVWTQSVGGDGSPMGSPVRVPGTSGMSDISSQRIGLVTRPSGGFYTAFPIASSNRTNVVLWRIGNTRTRTIARIRNGGVFASVTVDARGRLWMFWARNYGGHPKVFARRSNRAATKFGAVVKAGAPRHAALFFNVDGNASNRALDVFANTQIGSSSTSATWTRHIFPGLTLKAKPRRLVKGQLTRVRFTVTDAGSPVRRALVRVAGKSGRTNRHGRLSLRLRLTHRVRATATHKHYTKARLKLRVRG